jgi:uncharacterized membrane protein YuzA (DUF378 family)
MTNQSTYYKNYRTSKMHIFLMFLVIIGSINWGLEAINCNLVKLLAKNINKLLNMEIPIDKIIYIFVALAGISLAVRKNTWLPFLGWTVFPSSLLEVKNPDKFDTKIKIKTKPNVKIIYWAATGKGNPNQDVLTAYNNKNNGIVFSDSNGIAEFNILEGDSYIVPSGKQIPKHIHYRIVESDMILGNVKSVYY